MFIDQTTSREDLLQAIHDERELFWAFVEADIDFVKADTETVRQFIMDWVVAGDECAGCA